MEKVDLQDDQPYRRAQQLQPEQLQSTAGRLSLHKRMVDLTGQTAPGPESKRQNTKTANRIRNFFLKKKTVAPHQPVLQRNASRNLTFEDDEAFRELDDLYEIKNDMKLQRRNKQLADTRSFVISEERVDPVFDKKLKNLNIQRIKHEDGCYLRIVEMNDFESLEVYTDRFPLLRIRKALMYLYYCVQHFCLYIVRNPVFEFCSISLIVINTVFLMMDDPTTKSATSLADTSDKPLTIMYTVEACLKITAYGFLFGRTPYIRELWNILDFVIILSSWLTYGLASVNVNLSALRSLRVLRPLRTISSIKKLKALIMTIFSSIPFLIDILLILLFVYLLFAIAGLNLFNGVLHRRCISEFGVISANNTYCNDNSACPTGFSCASSFTDSLTGITTNYTNPDSGVTSFDNIASSMLMVFQITSTEGWFTILGYLQTAFPGAFQAIVILYFVILIFIGNFFLLNLMLAVIIVKFNESQSSKTDALALVKHDKHCICAEGLAYNKMKLCGYFENMYKSNRRESMLTQTLKEIHTMNMRTKKRREATRDNRQQTDSDVRHLKMTQTAKSLADLDANPQSFSDGEESVMLHRAPSRAVNDLSVTHALDDMAVKADRGRNPDLRALRSKKDRRHTDVRSPDRRTQGQYNRSMANFSHNRLNSMDISANMLHMIESYNRVIGESPNIQGKFEPIDVKIDEEANESSARSSDENSQLLAQSIHTHGSGEKFKRDLMKTIMEERSSQDSRDSKEWTEMISEGDRARHTIYSMKKHKTASTFNRQRNIDKRLTNTTVPVKRAKLLTEEEVRIKNQLEKRLRYLKIDLNVCKVYAPMDLFDSRNDIFPSTARELQAKADRDKLDNMKKTHITTYYDKNRIMFELQSQTQRKAAKAPIKFSRVRQSMDSPHAQTISSILTLDTPGGTVSTDAQHVFAPADYFNVTDDYYPLGEPLHKLSTSNAIRSVVRSNQQDIRSKNSRQSKGMQQAKLLKQTVKNFQSVKEYFQDEFSVVEDDRSELYEAGKKALDCYYQSILDQDLRGNRIDKYNWSGFDVMPASSFTAPKFDSIIAALNNEITEIWLPGLWGKITVLRRITRQFMDSKFVENFCYFLVFANTTMLSLNGLVNDSWTPTLSVLNTIFTVLFTIEMALKMFGMGPRKYVKDVFNVFDAVIVGFSLFELCMGSGSKVASAVRAVRVFRAIRVLRVTRLLRALRFMKVIIEVIMSSLEQFIYIALLLSLFIIIFSLLGMQLFAGRFDFYQQGEVKEQNFDTFVSAFLVVYQVMTIENWNDVLVLCMRSSQSPVVTVIYLISWIFSTLR